MKINFKSENTIKNLEIKKFFRKFKLGNNVITILDVPLLKK